MRTRFEEITSEAVRTFKKKILEGLEAFNDIYADWERKSSFPFLHLTSREYYLQKDFENIIENYTRYILVNRVLQKLLREHDSHFEFLEYILDAMKPSIRTNREYEQEQGFEFIEYREDKTIGFRYTFLPVGKPFTEPLVRQIQEERMTEVVIIDWSLQESASKPVSSPSPCFQNIVIRYVTIKEFFSEYLDNETYTKFISYLKSTILELQEYLGVVTIPRLTPSLLFGFRYEVERAIIEHLSELESKRSIWKSCISTGQSNYAYCILDESTKNNVHYADLERRSIAFLYNTHVLRQYQKKKYYRALIGRANFARCLITSEYLFRNYGKSDQFDYTAVASGYLKSVEQLMFCLALFFIDKTRSDGKYFQIAPRTGRKENTIDFTTDNLNAGRVDTTLGALCFFFKNNRDTITINGPYKKTLINCLFCYADECRNDSFHKHNIDEWSRVEAIRTNTFLMYIMLLGGCQFPDDDSEVLSKLRFATDDRLSRIYHQLTTHDTLDYYVDLDGQETIEICRPREEEYPSFDEFGILQKDSLVLEVEHFNGSQPDKPQTITISDDNLPTRIWFEDENDWSIEHNLDY